MKSNNDTPPTNVDESVSISLKAFEGLLKSSAKELKALLEEVEICFTIDGTKACSNCHFIKLSGNGQVRFKDLAAFLAKKIIDFAIPRSEQEKALDHLLETRSYSEIAGLQIKAQNLFSRLKKSGEGGEILLYILIEEILKAPQLLCKMSLKTSPNMHVHGCDGIHASYDESADLLSLFWGESKLYKDLKSAVAACFESLKSFLLDNGGSKGSQERDIQLVRSFVDLGDERLENAIITYLDKDHEKFNQVIYKGACLIGFDYNKYPSKANAGITLSMLKTEVISAMEEWKSEVKDAIKQIDGLDSFELHIFFLPFPSVQEFRDAFLKELGINRSDDTTE